MWPGLQYFKPDHLVCPLLATQVDTLEEWYAHIVDLQSLLGHWEARRAAKIPVNRKDREILTICFFALCVEHSEQKRFLVGFPNKGEPKAALLRDLFEPTAGEVDDWDVLLIPDLGVTGPSEREFHQCQIVGYTGRKPPGTDDLIQFLEEKKLCRAGGDLRLIIHLEQPTWFDWVKLAIHLQMRRPKCPYSQVFVLSTTIRGEVLCWKCSLLFPTVAMFKELDIAAARMLLRDRPTICVLRPVPHTQGDLSRVKT